MRLLLSFSVCLSFLFGYSQNIREMYQDGLKAHESGDYELFLAKMISIDSIRPNYPSVVYNIAGGYALTEQKKQAIATLDKYILMDALQDFSKDDDFKSILGSPEFARIKKKQEQLNSVIPIEASASYSLQASHPESITYDEKNKTYYIGGVRDGTIWSIANGKEELWTSSPAKSWSVMGLQVSPDSKFLWVCTSSMINYEVYKGVEEGYASVLKYDLESKELLKTYVLSGGHNFGDLITDKNGNVFISDGTANKLYWINNEKDELEEFVDLSKNLFNLQGLALDLKGNHLFLSDYIDGIYRLNLTSKNLEKLKISDASILIKGVDGLYYKNNALIALHNGTKPNRVIKYQLSNNERSLIGKEVLGQAGDLGEPTQGVWVDDSFQFIMNSPWASYDNEGVFLPKEAPVIIGIIK